MSTIKVGFFGASGSFSEEATFNYFSNNIQAMPNDRFEDIFISLQNNDIDYGVLPIENSSTGAVSEVSDLLNKYNFYIVGETYVKVNHNLLGIKGATIDDIKKIYSHPQAFDQCKSFLCDYTWQIIPYYSTAKSAAYIKDMNDKTIAAIGSKRACEIYDLSLLSETINYNTTNTTRFVIIGKSLNLTSVCNKISVVLSTHHKAGSLFHVLKHFAENNINMLKIESRPIQHTPWEYYFYIDFEGNLENEIIKIAIDHMHKDCHHFKILGNYRQRLC